MNQTNDTFLQRNAYLSVICVKAESEDAFGHCVSPRTERRRSSDVTYRSVRTLEEQSVQRWPESPRKHLQRRQRRATAPINTLLRTVKQARVLTWPLWVWPPLIMNKKCFLGFFYIDFVIIFALSWLTSWLIFHLSWLSWKKKTFIN